MRIRIASLTLVVAMSLFARAAAAQDDSLARAREYFDKAQTLFEAGTYDKAAEYFDKAYDARPFPQFLFNIGVCYEKLQKWQLAIDYYNRYLAEKPEASDKEQLRERIKVLERERDRVEEAKKNAPPANPANPEATPPAQPSKEVANLSDVAIQGLVVIESKPQGATIYLDDRKAKPLGKTPWSGTLKGRHKLFIESKGYKPEEHEISAAPDRLVSQFYSLAEEDYLGWIEIKSNIPGASIYIDDKASGVFQKTPYSGNIKPGKHEIWVTKDGYSEYYQEINIIRGNTHEVMATLKGSEVGYLNVRGPGIQFTSVYMDGKVLCERGPCRKPVSQGVHTVTFKRNHHKPYKRTVAIQQKTETTVTVRLAEEPGRADAITAYVFAAAFGGLGIYCGLRSDSIKDDVQGDLDKGVLVDSADERLGWKPFKGGKFWAVTADAAYGLAGISLITAVYYTFRDKGAPSSGESDVRALALEPSLSPDFSGVTLGGRF